MSLLDRIRPSRLFAARPSPQTPADLELGVEQGDYGGRREESYTGALGASLRPLLASRKLTPRNVAEMRRHYQVSACLTVLAMPSVRAEWTIECDDDDVRDWITAAYDRVATDVHASSTRALWAGYSPNFLRWDVDPELGGLVVTKIRDLPPETCEPLVDELGSFGGFVQNRQAAGNAKRYDVGPLEALWLVEGMESGNLYGRSVLEAALDPWLDHTAVRLFHARYLERFGEPVVKTRAPAGTAVANEQEILDAIAAKVDDPSVVIPEPITVSNLTRARMIGENLRHHSVVALPSDHSILADGKTAGYAWDLDYLESSANGGADFREALDVHDRSIARALFVPDLLFANTDGGAYALGREHRSVFDARIESRLDDNARQITRHLIDRYRRWNFGDRAPAARLVFGGVTDTDREELWQLATTLVEGGRLPVDVEAIGARLGIPLMDADAQAAATSPETAANPFASVGLPALIAAGVISEQEGRDLLGIPGTAPGKPDPTVGAALSAELVDQLVQLARSGRPDAASSVRRFLGLRETIIAGPPERAVASVSSEPGAPWIELLGATRDPVAGLPDWQLPQSYDPPPYRRELTTRERRATFSKLEAGLNAAEVATIGEIVDTLEQSRERVLRQLRGVLKAPTLAEQLAAVGTLELGPSTREAKSWDALLRNVWTLGLESVAADLVDYAEQIPTTLGPEARALAATYAQASAERHFADLSTRLRLQLANGLTSGVTSSGLTAIVGDLFEREVSSEARPMRLTTRMLAAKGMNEGRRDAIERGGVPLRGAQYSALLDRRTCDLCLELDELVIAVESTDLARFTPPVHHNCRCVWVWITRDEADFTPTWSTPSPSKVDRYGGLVI